MIMLNGDMRGRHARLACGDVVGPLEFTPDQPYPLSVDGDERRWSIFGESQCGDRDQFIEKIEVDHGK